MAARRTPVGGATRHAAERRLPVTAGWSAAGAMLCATALLLSMVVPSPLTLLASGCVLATAGFAMAAALFLSGRRMGRDGTAGWDLASALVFLGLAAVLLSDTGEALTALADLRAR